MDSYTNIILKPYHTNGDFEDPVIIQKAGYYQKIVQHKIYRGLRYMEGVSEAISDEEKIYHTDTIDEAVLLYCVDGEGFLMDSASTYKVEKGSIVFCDKNAIHAYGANPDNPWTIYWFHFKGAFTEYFSKAINSFNGCTTVKIGYSGQIIHMMQQSINLLLKYTDFIRRTTANSYLKACLCEILLNLGERNCQSNPLKEVVDKSLEYMKSNVDGNITLEHLSGHVGLSKYYYSRQFKLITGFSPIEYFNQLKVQKACDLLDNNKYSIKEISSMLGFSTPYYFSESFRKHTGFSPGIYKKLKMNKY